MRFINATCCLIILLLLSQAYTDAKILFVSDDSLTGEGRSIYVMDDDGSNVTLLSHQPWTGTPRWSPDGKQIVFDRRTKQNSNISHIFIMNVDGTDIRQLTTVNDGNPSFSPDGKSIVFGRYEVTPNALESYICLMQLESGIVKKIANVEVSNPSFSPDGKHIVFSGVPIFGKSGANIWIMGADGRNLRELLPPLPQGLPIIDRFFSKISPDGNQLLYFQSEVIPDQIDGVAHLIPQAYRYFIYDLITGQSQELKIPKNYKCAGLDWMDGNKAIVFSAYPDKLNEVELGKRKYTLYKYDIWTREITILREDMVDSFIFPDWISDDVLSVSPVGKQPIQWGKLKAFLNSRIEALKTFSSSLSVFLSN